jgi:hypothetical protein
MKEDELAMAIAALIKSTDNPGKLEKLESSISELSAGLNEASVRSRVDHYLSNPPKDFSADSFTSSIGNDRSGGSSSLLVNGELASFCYYFCFI